MVESYSSPGELDGMSEDMRGGGPRPGKVCRKVRYGLVGWSDEMIWQGT